jgi:hypothetical protein
MNTTTRARSDQVLAALEGGVGVLRALELAAAEIDAETGDVQSRKEHLENAIELVRLAISEMRSYQDGNAHLGAAGFVVAVKQRRLQFRGSSGA